MSNPTEIISKNSGGSVAETVAQLLTEIEDRGLKIFAVIDHSGEAQRQGLELRDTNVVIFGSARAGTPVMQTAPLIALDLPLKVLVFDDHGTTTLSYLEPDALVRRYGLERGQAAAFVGIHAITDAVVR